MPPDPSLLAVIGSVLGAMLVGIVVLGRPNGSVVLTKVEQRLDAVRGAGRATMTEVAAAVEVFRVSVYAWGCGDS
jgi:hypothetical protein